MSNLFLYYPTCGTCRKAAKWLKQHDVAVHERHIAEQPPTRSELEGWITRSGQPVQKFFNTSGKRYRELGMKDRIRTESPDQLLDLLDGDGMLVKRPILVLSRTVLAGFDENRWSAAIAAE